MAFAHCRPRLPLLQPNWVVGHLVEEGGKGGDRGSIGQMLHNRLKGGVQDFL